MNHNSNKIRRRLRRLEILVDSERSNNNNYYNSDSIHNNDVKLSNREVLTRRARIRTRTRTSGISNRLYSYNLLIVSISFALSLLFIYQSQVVQCQQGSNHLITQYHQHNNILHFLVSENAPNGTYLGNIRSSDGQAPYLVLPSPDTPEHERQAALSINLSNGDLTTNGNLDRETREQYDFVAIVKEPFAEIKCTVTVQDVNDNVPMFLLHNSSDTNFVIEFPEEWPIDRPPLRKPLPLAIDLDSPQFGIKEFRLLSGNTPKGLFQLVEFDVPVNRSSQLAAQKQNQLDQDPANSLMNAHHQSFSGANQNILDQLAQQASVLIPSQPTLNIYGQSSQFHPSSHLSSSSSSSSSQSSSPTQIASSIGSGSQSQEGKRQRGQIELVAWEPLDREKQSSYQLTVEAIDGGQPPLLGRLMVTINVQDINDNSPKFTHDTYECHTREDTITGALLHRVQAHDKDAGSNAQISYFIVPHSRSTSSSSPSSSSQLTNSSQSNFSDKMNDQQQSRFVVHQSQNNLTNISNNNRQIPQQQQPKSSVTNSNGKQRSPNDLYDPNRTNGGECTQDQMFRIDSVTGGVYLACELDFETQQIHELLIEARDHGQPSRSGFAILKVHVTDVNDDPPANLSPTRLTDTNGQTDKGSQMQSLSHQQPSSEASRADGSRSGNELHPFDSSFQAVPGVNGFSQLQNLNLTAWFAQINSSLLFVLVLVALFAIAFPVCLVKIKSRQPESDYNDTAGLTLSPNGHPNGQLTKHSPNHSSSSGNSNDLVVGNDGNLIHQHHHSRHHHHSHHHDHLAASSLQRRTSHQNGGSFAGLAALANSGGHHNHLHQYVDSSNLYHNPYPQRHSTSSSSHLLSNQQMAPTGNGPIHLDSGDSPHQVDHLTASNNLVNGGGSGENTMTTLHNRSQQHLLPQQPQQAQSQSHNHNHHPLLGSANHSHHHNQSLEHHQFPSIHSGNHSNNHQAQRTSSLTYAHHHTRQLMQQQQQHKSGQQPSLMYHPSLHHLSSIHRTNNSTNSNTINNIHCLTSTTNNLVASNYMSNSANNKGGTMNSLNTHQSAASPSALPATPNTGHSSGLPINGHEGHQTLPLPPSNGNEINQLPAALSVGHINACLTQQHQSHLLSLNMSNGACLSGSQARDLSACHMDNICQVPSLNQAPLDRWFDLGVSSQLVYALDWFGSYNWNYLDDWTPEYQPLMPLLTTESCVGY